MSHEDDLSLYQGEEGNALLTFSMILGLYRERDFYAHRLRPWDWDLILGEFPEFREAVYPTIYGDYRNLDQIVRDDTGFCLSRQVIDDYLEEAAGRSDLPEAPATEPVLPPELLLEVKSLLPADEQEESKPLDWEYYQVEEKTGLPVEAGRTETPVGKRPEEYIFLCPEEDACEGPALEQVPSGRLYGFGTIPPPEDGPLTLRAFGTEAYISPGGSTGFLRNLFRGNVDVRYNAHTNANVSCLAWHVAEVIAIAAFSGRIVLLVRSREHAADRTAPSKAIDLRKRLWCPGAPHIIWRDRLTYTSYTGNWLYKNTQVVIFEPYLNTHLVTLGGLPITWDTQVTEWQPVSHG